MCWMVGSSVESQTVMNSGLENQWLPREPSTIEVYLRVTGPAVAVF